ncbi:hypothetical protein LRH25_12730 [Ideonella azotifigens]|uniref:Uncharacterized protein n=1 Tax=Ideonella azotifigens TaxID=513160 RepID=A0ABN1JWM3_9BURK|nr:hypothetical protein [Ideonella azotifigens]MCD2341206.1 hypothetical protein [Ideonella azotifigens]
MSQYTESIGKISRSLVGGFPTGFLSLRVQLFPAHAVREQEHVPSARRDVERHPDERDGRVHQGDRQNAASQTQGAVERWRVGDSGNAAEADIAVAMVRGAT